MSLAQAFPNAMAAMAPPAPAMPGPNLDDPSRFVVIPAVPIVKTHEADHDKSGKVVRQAVTADRMRLLVENGNRRARSGDYGIVTIGHTNDGPDEHGQPEYVGYAKNYRVADRFGEKVILADLFIHRSKAAKAATFPRRSAEVWGGTTPSDHFIDIISLLRRTPRFDLGAWDQDEVARYHRMGGLSESATLARYSCDVGPEDGGNVDPVALDRGLRALGLPGLARYAKQGELFDDSENCGTGAGGFQQGNACGGRKGKGKKADDSTDRVGDFRVAWEADEDDENGGRWLVYDADGDWLDAFDSREDALDSARQYHEDAEDEKRLEAANEARDNLSEAYSTLERVADECEDAGVIDATRGKVAGIVRSLQADCPDRNSRRLALDAVLARYAATNCPGGDKGKFGRGNDCHKTRARERAEKEVKRTKEGNPSRAADFAKRIRQADSTGDDDRLTDAGRKRKAAELAKARRAAMEQATGKKGADTDASDQPAGPGAGRATPEAAPQAPVDAGADGAEAEAAAGAAKPPRPEQTYSFGGKQYTREQLAAKLKADGLDDDAVGRFFADKTRRGMAGVLGKLKSNQAGFRDKLTGMKAKGEGGGDAPDAAPVDDSPPTPEELAQDAAEAEAMRAERGIVEGRTSGSLDRPADRTIKLNKRVKTPATSAAHAAHLDQLDAESHLNNATKGDTSPEYRNHLRKQAMKAAMRTGGAFEAAGMAPPRKPSLDASRTDIGDGLDAAEAAIEERTAPGPSEGADSGASMDPLMRRPEPETMGSLARKQEQLAAVRRDMGFSPEAIEAARRRATEGMERDRARAASKATATPPAPSAFEAAQAEAARVAPGTLAMPKSTADPDAFTLRSGPVVGGGGSGRTVQGSMFGGSSALDAETDRPRRKDLPGQTSMFGGGEGEGRKAPHESLLDQAAKFSTYGENYNRNIAAPANRLRDALDRGHEPGSNLIKGLMAELEQRLQGVASSPDRSARRLALDSVLSRYGKADPADDPRVMVGFWLPEDVAEKLALPKGEPADQLHLTLCYLGRRSKIGTDGVERIEAAVRDLASNLGTITATLGGPGRFPASVASDGKDVVIATVDSPGLAEFRERIASHLRNTAVEPSTDHDFNPHVTLAYIAPGRRLPVQRIEPTEVTFDEIVVVVGDERRAYPLRKDGPGFLDHPMAMMGSTPVSRYSRESALNSVLARYDRAPKHRPTTSVKKKDHR